MHLTVHAMSIMFKSNRKKSTFLEGKKVSFRKYKLYGYACFQTHFNYDAGFILAIVLCKYSLYCTIYFELLKSWDGNICREATLSVF